MTCCLGLGHNPCRWLYLSRRKREPRLHKPCNQQCDVGCSVIGLILEYGHLKETEIRIPLGLCYFKSSIQQFVNAVVFYSGSGGLFILQAVVSTPMHLVTVQMVNMSQSRIVQVLHCEFSFLMPFLYTIMQDFNPAYNLLLQSELLGYKTSHPISPDKHAQLEQLKSPKRYWFVFKRFSFNRQILAKVFRKKKTYSQTRDSETYSSSLRVSGTAL